MGTHEENSNVIMKKATISLGKNPKVFFISVFM
jgi:hypothetical protein